jgi:hypothetical protein
MITVEIAHHAARFRYPEELQMEAQAQPTSSPGWPVGLLVLIALPLFGVWSA